jgi:uncharacterized protein (TIGR02099 family)
MTRLLRSFAAKLWLALILLIILSGIAVATLRLLLPMADLYRQDAQQLASEVLGQPVTIDELSAQWRGFGPELTLKGVQLVDTEGNASPLQLSEIRIGIGLFDTLLSGSLTPREITFYGARLLIKRRSDGSIVVSGLEALERGGQESGALLFLPHRIALKESELYWENQAIGAKPLRFTDVSFSLTNDGNHHQLDATLYLPDQENGVMALSADFEGELHRPGAWSGDFYLYGQTLSLAKLLEARIPDDYQIQNGTTDMEIWSHWEKGRLANLEGSLGWKQLRMAGPAYGDKTERELLEIEQLSNRFRWQRSRDGWALDISDIVLKRQGRSWPSSRFSMVAQYDPQGRLHLRSGVDFLRFEDVWAIIGMFPLPWPELDEALTTIQPHTDLHRLQLRYDETSAKTRWSARGQVRNFSSQPWKTAPGLANMDMRFRIDQDGGEMALEGNAITATFPKLFRQPLLLNGLLGHLHWRQHPEKGWIIESDGLEAHNQDIRTRSNLRLELPIAEEEPLFLDLQTSFRDGDVSSTHRYLPVHIMSDPVVEWLERSIVKGRITQGNATFRGPARDFPFEKKSSGRFEVRFGVEDLRLDYWPQWPSSEQLSGEIRFLNNRFDAWIKKGRMLNSTLQNLHGRIERLSRGSPFLLSGEISGPLEGKLALLRESPLKEKFAPLTRNLKGRGKARLKLDLAIPLLEGEFRLDGSLAFLDSTLFLKEWEQSISNIRGDLHFDEKGVRAKQLEGRFLDEKISAQILPPLVTGNSTNIAMQGRFPGNKLAALLPGKGKWLQGSAEWKLLLRLPSFAQHQKETPSIGLELSSDLHGVTLPFPPPFGKQREERRPFHLATELGGTQHNLHLRYDDIASALLQFEGEKRRMVRGDLRLGGGDAQLPQREVMRIRGQLERLDLTPWLGLEDMENGLTEWPDILVSSLQFGHLQFGDTVLENARLDLQSDDHGLSGEIHSKRLDGRAEIPLPLEQKPVVLRFSRMDLSFDPEQLSELQQAEDESAGTDPRKLPALDLKAEKVNINGHDFGQLEMRTQRAPGGVMLDHISLLSGQVNLFAQGKWIVARQGPLTDLHVDLQTESLGQTLQQLGFYSNIEKAPAKMVADVQWDGNPRQFSSELNGKVTLDLEHGRFLEIEPGLGRVFGLLNIGALQRRLTLDFSDLFSKGFSFDHVHGSFQLENGDAYTKDFRVEAPSANIDISGRTGLVAQDFDQLVMVTPGVSTTIPLAGGVAGGPAVGAALLLAQKLFGKQIDKVSNIQYTVTGPWKKPIIKRQGEKLESRFSRLFEGLGGTNEKSGKAEKEDWWLELFRPNRESTSKMPKLPGAD